MTPRKWADIKQPLDMYCASCGMTTAHDLGTHGDGTLYGRCQCCGREKRVRTEE